MKRVSEYAAITDKSPLIDAIDQAERIIRDSSFVAADIPLLNHAYKTNPEIKEYLDNNPVDAYSSLGFQLIMRSPIIEISHFPQKLRLQPKKKLRYREVLENPPALGSTYRTRIVSAQQSPENTYFSDVFGKLLVGNRKSSLTLDDEFLRKEFTPFADVSELRIEDRVIRKGDDNKQFMLLHPDFLQD